MSDAELVTVRADAGERMPGPGEVDAVVVLGGSMTAYDDEVAPWLPGVREQLRTWVTAGTPTLGICLGAQLLAVALGGEVERSAPAGPERGVVELRLRPAAAEDPLLGPLAGVFGRDVPAPSSHQDAISVLPPESVWLASSRRYPFQAFRTGSACGLQFHPEADLDTLLGWETDHGGDADALAALRARYAAHEHGLRRLATVVGAAVVELASARAAR